MSPEGERGWLPDLLYRDGHFDSGIAIFADPQGRITRFSSESHDLKKAVRLSNRAILPGLVNVHSHSFQRAIRGRTEYRTGAERDTFWTWREAMYHAANVLSPDDIFHVARMAFLEMLLTGITTVGEFHYLHHAADGTPYQDRNLLAHEVIRAATEVGLRIALLRTAYVRAGWRKDADPGQSRFLTHTAEDFISDTEQLSSSLRRSAAPDLAWVGIAPHSIRAVPLSYLLEVENYARRNGMKVHMHVAEQPAEIEACQAEYGRRPVELLSEYGILSSRFTAVHATHVTRGESDEFGRAKSFICACGTTERNLGDGIAPADLWARADIPVCFGSDSNVQIDLLEDARQLEYHLRLRDTGRVILSRDQGSDSLAQSLFSGATETGAQSLLAPGGSLEAGRTADFFTVDLNDPSIAGADATSLLTNIVFSAERTVVRDVYVN